MNWWHAFILGLVEGITEYLPVSSTGHLLLVQRLLGIEQGEAADAFAICIQAGAILAVLGLYRKRVGEMINGLLGKNEVGRKLAINLLAALVPALALGLLLQKPIKKYLFGGQAYGLWPVVFAWFVGGVAILAVSIYRKRRQQREAPRFELEGMPIKAAVIIGFSQCIAMWPGTSRSLVTIVGGILVGLRLRAAVEFSFLLGVLTLGAATAHDALEHGRAMLSTYGAGSLALGFAVAWISAVLAVKWMVGYLNKHGFSLFGYYRIVLAVVVGAAIWAGFIAH